jgi:hypothetical protein
MPGIRLGELVIKRITRQRRKEEGITGVQNTASPGVDTGELVGSANFTRTQ